MWSEVVYPAVAVRKANADEHIYIYITFYSAVQRMTDKRRMVDAQEKPLVQDAWRSESERST